jgi:hypothetical protein
MRKVVLEYQVFPICFQEGLNRSEDDNYIYVSEFVRRGS